MRIRGKEIWWAIVAGCLTSLSWPPVGLWLALFLGPAAHLVLVSQSANASDRQHRFMLHLVFLLSAWILPFHWVALHPIPITALTSVLALLAYAMLFAATLAVLPRWLQRIGVGGSLLPMILAWSLFDWLLGQTPFAMPWLRLGMAAAPSDWSLFWVRVVGPIGLTFLALSSVGVIESIRRKTRFKWVFLAVFLAMSLGPSAQSIWISSSRSTDLTINDENTPDELKLVLVQPGWSPEEWANIADPTRLERLESLLIDTPRDSDALLLPETSLPPLTSEEAQAAVKHLSNRAGLPVIAGAILIDSNAQAWNAVISSESTYLKRHLVPFAEYVPFSSTIPFFSVFSVPAGGVAAYVPGDAMELFQVGNATAGVLICFESLFLRDGRTYARNGADLLIVQTQDGWGRSGAPRSQHVSFTQLLAAASGLPVAQVSVDGTSALIDAQGHIVLEHSEGGPVLETGRLTLSNVATPYRAMGDWIFCLSFVALAGWSIVSNSSLFKSYNA